MNAGIFRSSIKRYCQSTYTRSIYRKVDVNARKAASSQHYYSTTSSGSKIGFVGWYLGMIKSRPILTKSITSSFIYTSADFISQTLSKSDSEAYDLVRSCRMAGYGMVAVGPMLHFWFNFASKAFPGRNFFTTSIKIITGQAIGAVMTVTFFSSNAALQGETGSEIIARLKRDLFPTLLNGVMYWPVCDFITYRFVPVHLQPLTNNAFAFLWNVYLTYMANLEKVSTISKTTDDAVTDTLT